jgi:hypothetical protein
MPTIVAKAGGIPNCAGWLLHKTPVWYSLNLINNRMPEANDNAEPAASPERPKVYPGFRDDCRARSLWSVNEFAECLVTSPENCEYALRHGDHYYCYHPQRQEIVIRTLKIIRGMTH